jgi:hypothetical protein
MGHQASAARVQMAPAFVGIGDTIAIGCVLYDSSFPIVPEDTSGFWLEKTLPVSPLFRSKIFISSLEIQALLPLRKPIFGRSAWSKPPHTDRFQTGHGEGRSNLELSKSSGLDLKLKRTQPALEVVEEVEDHYESAMASHALET